MLTEKSVYVTAATAVGVVWEPSRLQHIVPGSGYGYLHHVRSDRGPHSQLSRVGQTRGVPAVRDRVDSLQRGRCVGAQSRGPGAHPRVW